LETLAFEGKTLLGGSPYKKKKKAVLLVLLHRGKKKGKGTFVSVPVLRGSSRFQLNQIPVPLRVKGETFFEPGEKQKSAVLVGDKAQLEVVAGTIPWIAQRSLLSMREAEKGDEGEAGRYRELGGGRLFFPRTPSLSQCLIRIASLKNGEVRMKNVKKSRGGFSLSPAGEQKTPPEIGINDRAIRNAREFLLRGLRAIPWSTFNYDEYVKK